MSSKTKWPELTPDMLPPRGGPKARQPGKGSRRHPLLRARPKGVWYPDLVGVVKGYPKTQEAFNKKQEQCRAQVIRLNSEGKMGRTGVRDGMAGTKHILKTIRQKRTDEAERIIDLMVEKKIIEEPDEMAREALGYAISVVRTSSDVEKTTDKLKAASLVLEYTRTKPTSKSEVTLNKAEDFLMALANEANGR
jgi:hypothetical protein